MKVYWFFDIEHKVSAIAYKLNLPHRYSIYPVVCISQLKAFGIPSTQLQPSALIRIIVEREEKYIVEHLTHSKGYRKYGQYLVRWQGYDAAEDTWESKENPRQRVSEVLGQYKWDQGSQ